jgi:multiple sugar transport system permease protein
MALTRRARFAYMLVLPSLLLLTMLNLFPLAQGIIASLQRQNMTRPNPYEFVGLAHFAEALFSEGSFWSSLLKTCIWTVGSVSGAYVLGLALALLLNLDIRGRNIFRALFLVPWVIPDVVTALVWKWLYNDEYGVINFLLRQLHVINSPVHWLSDLNLAMPSVILAQIWKLYPLMTVVLLAALQNVPKELHEAASLDGARPWQRFFYVTLPLIRTTSVSITLLTGIWTFQSFDLVYLLTGGGPADATQILPTFIYQKAFFTLDLGYASALGLLMLLIILAISSLYLFVSRPSRVQA